MLIGAFPGIEILLNKRADVFWRCLHRCNLHNCLFLDAVIASPWDNCIRVGGCRRERKQCYSNENEHSRADQEPYLFARDVESEDTHHYGVGKTRPRGEGDQAAVL